MRKTLTRAGFIVAATAAFLGSGGHCGRAATARTDDAKGQSSGPAVPLAPLPDGNVARAFAFDPHQPDVVYVASANAHGGVYVFKTTDNGQHWTSTEPQGAGWMSDVLSLTADPRHSGTLYAGTDTAVYKTTNGGHSWRPFKQGLFPAPHQTCSGPPGRSPCWKYPYYGTPGKTSSGQLRCAAATRLDARAADTSQPRRELRTRPARFELSSSACGLVAGLCIGRRKRLLRRLPETSRPHSEELACSADPAVKRPVERAFRRLGPTFFLDSPVR